MRIMINICRDGAHTVDDIGVVLNTVVSVYLRLVVHVLLPETSVVFYALLDTAIGKDVA